jgi:hypothetical protein
MSSNARRFSQVRRMTCLSIVITGLLAGCGGSDRPSFADWETLWSQATSSLPDQSELSSPPDEALCESTVAALRTSADNLLPTPDIALDSTVRSWLSIAEDAFFDCPPSGDADISSFDDAYRELGELQAEVDLVITANG